MDLTKKQRLVLQAIKDFPAAANDDPLLLSIIWGREGWNSQAPLYENLRKVSRSESITRARRKLHELGLIHYSTEAEKKRMDAFRNERDSNSKGGYYGSN